MEEIYYKNITTLQDRINTKVKNRIGTLSYQIMDIVEKELIEFNFLSQNEAKRKKIDMRKGIEKAITMTMNQKLIESECEKLINK